MNDTEHYDKEKVLRISQELDDLIAIYMKK